MITEKPEEGEIVCTPTFINILDEDNVNRHYEMMEAFAYHDERYEPLFTHGLLYKDRDSCYDASERLSKALKWHFLRERAIELAKKENNYIEGRGGYYAVWDGLAHALDIRYQPMGINLPVLLFPTKETLFDALFEFGVDNYCKYILEMEDRKHQDTFPLKYSFDCRLLKTQ